MDAVRFIGLRFSVRWLGYRAAVNLFTTSTDTVRALGWQAEATQYIGCADVVRKSCSFSAVSMQSPQNPNGNRTAFVLSYETMVSYGINRLCRNLKISPCDHGFFMRFIPFVLHNETMSHKQI